MNNPTRRRFLTTLAAGLVAAVAPEFVLPTRTIIDMNPKGLSVWTPTVRNVRIWNRALSPDEAEAGLILHINGLVSGTWQAGDTVYNAKHDPRMWVFTGKVWVPR